MIFNNYNVFFDLDAFKFLIPLTKHRSRIILKMNRKCSYKNIITFKNTNDMQYLVVKIK